MISWKSPRVWLFFLLQHLTETSFTINSCSKATLLFLSVFLQPRRSQPPVGPGGLGESRTEVQDLPRPRDPRPQRRAPWREENHLTPGDTDLVPQMLLDNQAEEESEAGVGLERDEEDVPLCEDVELQDRDLSPKEKRFLREFPRLKEDLKGNIDKLRALAEDIDNTHKKFTKANIVINSTAVISDAMSLLGLAFAPVTGGASLLLSGAGQVLAAAAGVTSIVSGMLEKSENKKAQAQAEDILPTHDQEDREEEVNRADYATAAVKIAYDGVNVLKGAKKNIRAFQKFRADPHLASASKRLLTTGQVSSRSSRQIQKAFGGTTLAMTKNARLRGGVMSVISLGLDCHALSKGWKHLKEGARAELAEELRSEASEWERKLTELTQYYESLQQKVGTGQSTA
ncbi:apolipoprotein L6 isoform X1 [Papio anubis]|uniref:apolipoprotein L6 isoform X1 n=2 Tax=Papio anubis TaxID=9555 RepID=UPI0012AD6DF9|nr:apolipoprotein L6 isoform X1 [Papio anubis]XP_017800776.3 apolipoprotein L6 isoform X1 [Papio anubis]XP_031512212.1 apolipoprotein L6 isoform X1 [Papio anubis]XP_031512213.1 apolipoprotein L6 isoform X1 [Papio anubis]